MVSKFEAAGIGVSVAVMAVALYLLRVETSLLGVMENQTQTAAVVSAEADAGGTEAALRQAMTTTGELTKLVVEDVVLGSGPAVAAGDTVSVHYVGRLASGEEFDNSQKRGSAFTFTVGEGRVIAGWEQGILGMKAGGQRILVIPADLAYGNRQVGPIPPNATLVFSIELHEIK